MTLRQIVDEDLSIDPKTQENNIKFLSDISQKLTKEDQQKMQAVLQGLKQQQAANQQKKAEEDKQKQQEKSAQPMGNPANSAQPSGTNSTAQVSNSDSSTAQ